MKIEKAIHQTKPFRNNYQKAMVNLLFTGSWLNEQLRQIFQEFGISMKQYNILRILRGAGKPISTSVIRERLLDKMSDTSRIVDRMYKKELVTKKSCPDDKRLVDVSISEKGKTVLEHIDQHNAQIDQILSGLTLDEAQQLSELLDKIRIKGEEMK